MKPTHFTAQELVPQAIYDHYGDDSFMFIDNKILITLDLIREYFKSPVIVNNWHKGGNLENRCFRSWDTRVGARLSQHKLGKAVDFNVVGLTADEIRKEIIENQDNIFFESIMRMELGTSWVHIDIKPIDSSYQKRIYLFSP